MIDIIENPFVLRSFHKYTLLTGNQSAVISGQGSSSMVQKYVKGEYQPATYGYSSSQAPVQTEEKREVPGVTAEEPMHETSDVLGHIESGGPPVQTQDVKEQAPVVEKKEIAEFTAPFSAWDPSK